MHPHTYYSSLFEPAKRNEAFVIMSFSPEFDDRWTNVIEPAIREDLGLHANRVDFRNTGESIIHDILDGIAHAKFVIADITSSRMLDSSGRFWPQRNANVLWEVGIAHVTRLPDEVILIRSDSDPSIFDLTQFRAFQYDPIDVEESRQFIANLANDRIRAIDQTKSNYVSRCADSLDPMSAQFLLVSVPFDGREFNVNASMRNSLMLPRLFEMGILRAVKYPVIPGKNPGTFYVEGSATITPFGRMVIEHLASRIGISFPKPILVNPNSPSDPRDS